MLRVVIEIPHGIDEEEDERGVVQKIVLDALELGIELKALKKFEEMREEAWKEIKKKYVKKGLIECIFHYYNSWK